MSTTIAKGKIFKSLFAKQFRIKLILVYGSMPSCERVARDVRVASKGEINLHAKTIRKWINGEVFPDLNNFAFLIQWLDLDIIEISNNFKSAQVIYMELNTNSQSSYLKNYALINIEDVRNLKSTLDKIKK